MLAVACFRPLPAPGTVPRFPAPLISADTAPCAVQGKHCGRKSCCHHRAPLLLAQAGYGVAFSVATSCPTAPNAAGFRASRLPLPLLLVHPASLAASQDADSRPHLPSKAGEGRERRIMSCPLQHSEIVSIPFSFWTETLQKSGHVSEIALRLRTSVPLTVDSCLEQPLSPAETLQKSGHVSEPMARRG